MAIITEYGRLWPRKIFDCLESDGGLLIKDVESLKEHGVYILYRDDLPYYIGKAKDLPLFKRLHSHSNESNDTYFNFWNFFSFFVVPDINDIDEIESILIASMFTSNKANHKIARVKIPRNILHRMRKDRRNE